MKQGKLMKSIMLLLAIVMCLQVAAPTMALASEAVDFEEINEILMEKVGDSLNSAKAFLAKAEGGGEDYSKSVYIDKDFDGEIPVGLSKEININLDKVPSDTYYIEMELPEGRPYYFGSHWAQPDNTKIVESKLKSESGKLNYIKFETKIDSQGFQSFAMEIILDFTLAKLENLDTDKINLYFYKKGTEKN